MFHSLRSGHVGYQNTPFHVGLESVPEARHHGTGTLNNPDSEEGQVP